jgi:hypothetical protein
MDFHRPPSCAARKRRALVVRRSLGVVLVAGLAAAGCSSSADDASEPASDLPAELAADDVENGDGGTGTEDDLDGFGAVEDVETVPAVPVDADTVELTSEAPAEVIEDAAEELAGAEDGDELLDTLEPVDDAADAPSESDGRTRNGSGELVELDAEASLACANIEIAIGQLDGGFAAQAGEHVRSGAAQADASGIADIRSWAQPLLVAADTIDDPAPLVGFLSVCTKGGYEL